uniref:C-type lectin domain-containing protein n=1 Tax=Acrobeloides nanus TaxID=290746 RepID=A0A914CCQ4_9BILA
MLKLITLLLLLNLFYLFNAANSGCTNTAFKNAEVVCNNYTLSKGNETDILGHLVAIHNAFVNKFLVEQIVKYNISNVWLGAKSDYSEWTGIYQFIDWNDGSEIDYSNFAQYNNTAIAYLQMNATNGKWYPTYDETVQIPFICGLTMNMK